MLRIPLIPRKVDNELGVVRSELLILVLILITAAADDMVQIRDRVAIISPSPPNPQSDF